ncbi:MAG TPA: HemK2/MTQ2 family protein methyltransferase [Thermoplasmata archaeon]|nr:HemK2/MTQ2 family protein methyltransferase [Thermoplasmata archaeon]
MEPIRSHRAAGPPPKGARSGPGGTDDEPSVYPPREDTFLLLPFAEVAPDTRFLEVGTGTGLAALTAARRGARVVATDRNPHALRSLRRRALAERLDVGLVRTDLARGLGRFDRIVSNPPYLPTSREEQDPDRWHNLALDGGPDGCRVTARLVDELDQHLLPEGSAFVLVSSRQDPQGLERIRERFRSWGGRVDVVATRRLEGEQLDVWRLRPHRG